MRYGPADDPHPQARIPAMATARATAADAVSPSLRPDRCRPSGDGRWRVAGSPGGGRTVGSKVGDVPGPGGRARRYGLRS